MQTVHSKLKKIPTLIFQGFFALLPVIVTLYAAMFILGLIQNTSNNIIVLFPDVLKQNAAVIFFLKIILIGSFLFFLGFFGIFIRSMLGRGLLKIVNSFFGFIPGLNVVYKATEQVVKVLTSEKKSFFRKPVLVEYPSPGMMAIAFNTGEITIPNAPDRVKHYTVFIPTTPNPTSGFLAVLTEDKIREYDITAEDAIKLILTGGIVKHDNIDL